ncbi:hypothetical protein MYMA111404_04395 [Mycoplasma marinum]|uniref:Uncharacterized protein n=1 Tax=Mycoplasma marinum TaxID=1937190 RepID=A0A4R0XSF6_9MOLU|nr:hypothetical protein [Mycoplasma marinum]TCG10637.1 hypothetical protein C4B24_04315 [Mycoplasma marinum]
MASKSNKSGAAQRDQWFKIAIYATLMWLIGLVVMIIARAIDVHIVTNVLYALGAILFAFAWIIVLVFGIFTIIYSLTLKNNEQILGIICGILCILFPIVGVIMAWILYYKK